MVCMLLSSSFWCLGGQRVDLGAARVGENLMGDHWWRPYFSWKENQKDEARRQLAHQL